MREITYQEVDLGALVDDAHQHAGTVLFVQRIHPVAAEHHDADVKVHLDAHAQHLHLHGGVRGAAAQLDVVPQVAGVLDEGLLDVRLGDDGDLLEADDVLGAEDSGWGVEVVGIAGGAGAGRGLESGWGCDDAGGLERAGGDVLGTAFGDGPFRGGLVEDGEDDVVIEVRLCCCQLSPNVTRVDKRNLPKRWRGPCWRA
jgi:hypothetical protein